MVTENSPSAEAATEVEVSRLSAMFILPQGEEVEGSWTSSNVGAPSTPRAGATAAWALTEDVKARRTMGAMKDLHNILMSEIRAREVRRVKLRSSSVSKKDARLELGMNALWNESKDNASGFIHAQTRKALWEDIAVELLGRRRQQDDATYQVPSLGSENADAVSYQ
jgi:hypothetical protein